MWYFPGREAGMGEGGVHGVWLLMGGGMDRSEWIGFRCVADVKGEDKMEDRWVASE